MVVVRPGPGRLRGRQQRHDLVGKRLRRERLRVDAGDAVRRLADQAIGPALVDVEREPDAPIGHLGDADADRELVAELRRRPEPGLERGARHEDVERAQQPGAIAAEPAVQILLRVLEVPEEDAEPDDARRIGVGPHDAKVHMMEERHARGYSSLAKSIVTLATVCAASETLTGRAA